MTVDELRLRKRYALYLKKNGRCSVCQFRAQGGDGFHCRGWPDRVATCDTDGKLPAFRFDDQVLKGMRDAQ
ncbi:hypothetical protein [Stenotrophomonas bentonitica]|uniref:hypothetical protein n=1 Tax=Stenotrophomonas bentonitica TaxID=1450134 RepID=UPI00345EA244